eukprot:330461_1
MATEEKTEQYNLLKAAVEETTKKMDTQIEEQQSKNKVEIVSGSKLPDEIEEKFFKKHPEIATLNSKMKDSNGRHPLYDLTSSEHEKWVSELTELILKSDMVNLTDSKTIQKSIDDLTEFEYHCFNNMNKGISDYGLMYFLSFNNARSRLNMLLLQALSIKCTLTVIVPLYAEQHRMQNKATHKNGEDFIRRKVLQLSWLYNNISENEMDWNLLFVDDGCPNNSGKEAIKLIESDKQFFNANISKKISINFLENGINTIEKFKNDKNLNNTNDSRKGGAVQYGMYLALDNIKKLRENEKDENKQHFIMYTDADLSSNISQSGLLLADITINNKNNQRKVVIGDRYSKGIFSHGYVMGTFKTNEVALKLRAVFRGQLLPPFKNLYDTQCGFKIFQTECIEKVLPMLKSYKGMFDMELLLKAYDVYVNNDDEKDDEEAESKSNINMSELIYSTGVVWLHSAEETQFGAFTPDKFTNEYGWKHYNQLQQIISIHKNNYLNSKLCNENWINFIMKLNWKDYFKVCQIVYLTGIDVHSWNPELKDFNDMISQKYPEKAPVWIEDPSKKKKKIS